jgi:CRP-like cAMP-binding protein
MKSDKFYLIEKGEVAIRTGGANGDRELILHEGDTFGEWSLLAPPHLTSVTAKVTSPAQVLVLTREDFDEFAQAEPAIALKVVQGVMASLWATIKEVEGVMKECL